MDRVEREDVQRYLDANYLTLEDLSTRAGVAPDRVRELRRFQRRFRTRRSRSRSLLL